MHSRILLSIHGLHEGFIGGTLSCAMRGMQAFIVPSSAGVPGIATAHRPRRPRTVDDGYTVGSAMTPQDGDRMAVNMGDDARPGGHVALDNEWTGRLMSASRTATPAMAGV